MANKCSFDPSAPPYDTAAMGMFHCPECGEMVLAGVAHPDYSLIGVAHNTASTPTAGTRRQKSKSKSSASSVKPSGSPSGG